MELKAREVNYIFNTNKRILNGRSTLAFFSDLHDMNDLTRDRQIAILNNLKNKISSGVKIDAICIVGDILDDVKSNPDSKTMQFYESLGLIAPIFFVKGNHDHLSYINKQWIASDYHNKFYDEICKKFSSTYLNGKSIILPNNIKLIGHDFNSPHEAMKYYMIDRESKKSFEESNLIQNNKSNDNCFSISMFHSSINIMTNDGIAYYENNSIPELIVSGHVHRSMVPNSPALIKKSCEKFIDTIKGEKNCGLIDSKLKLFPSLSRDEIELNNGNTYGIILDPVVFYEPFQTNIILKNISNYFYKPGITYIEINENNNNLENKRLVKVDKYEYYR